MSTESENIPADSLEAGRSQAAEAADELREAAARRAREIRSQATEQVEHLREIAEDRYREARVRADDLQKEGERYVRENPTKSVLIALGLGFIIGRILK